MNAANPNKAASTCHSGNDAVVLEIVHPDGVLKIPKNMIESDEAFAALMHEIRQRVHATP